MCHTPIRLNRYGQAYLIDFMDPAGPIFAVCKKKKKWARSCACVRAPNCVVVTQLSSRKKINDIHGDFNDIHASFFFLPATRVTIFAGRSVKHEID